MAKLTAKQRKHLPAADFGLPKQRAYPMPDKTHARDAKARADAAYKQGKITGAQLAKIDRKADKKLKQ